MKIYVCFITPDKCNLKTCLGKLEKKVYQINTGHKKHLGVGILLCILLPPFFPNFNFVILFTGENNKKNHIGNNF